VRRLRVKGQSIVWYEVCSSYLLLRQLEVDGLRALVDGAALCSVELVYHRLWARLR
jgi:hypothetical protein